MHFLSLDPELYYNPQAQVFIVNKKGNKEVSISQKITFSQKEVDESKRIIEL